MYERLAEEQRNTKITPDVRVAILYGNLIKLLEDLQDTDQENQFIQGILTLADMILFILTTQTLGELEDKVDELTIALEEPCA